MKCIHFYVLFKDLNESIQNSAKKHGKSRFEISIFVIFAVFYAFGSKTKCDRYGKILISGKKSFARVLTICLPLRYPKSKKICHHHYHKVAISSDSYRQWLLIHFTMLLPDSYSISFIILLFQEDRIDLSS